jgi:hypothetical protein
LDVMLVYTAITGLCPVMGLLSDFGLRDPYVAEMKAVILGICEDVMLLTLAMGLRSSMFVWVRLCLRLLCLISLRVRFMLRLWT